MKGGLELGYDEGGCVCHLLQLAPSLSQSEEFQGHWRAITDCITSDNGTLAMSNLPLITLSFQFFYSAMCQLDVVTVIEPPSIVTLPNLSDASSAQSMGIDMHLGHMVELLCQEEEERDSKDPGSMVGGEKLLFSMRCMMAFFLSLLPGSLSGVRVAT